MSSGSLDLKSGTTMDCLILEGTIPVLRDALITCVNGAIIDSIISIIILGCSLSLPGPLLLSKDLHILIISDSVTGVKKNVEL